MKDALKMGKNAPKLNSTVRYFDEPSELANNTKVLTKEDQALKLKYLG